jgi:hypothetical protein
MTAELGGRILVGDDLLVTNTKFIARAVAEQACNAVLIKLNQSQVQPAAGDRTGTRQGGALRAVIGPHPRGDAKGARRQGNSNASIRLN